MAPLKWPFLWNHDPPNWRINQPFKSKYGQSFWTMFFLFSLSTCFALTMFLFTFSLHFLAALSFSTLSFHFIWHPHSIFSSHFPALLGLPTFLVILTHCFFILLSPLSHFTFSLVFLIRSLYLYPLLFQSTFFLHFPILLIFVLCLSPLSNSTFLIQFLFMLKAARSLIVVNIHFREHLSPNNGMESLFTSIHNLIPFPFPFYAILVAFFHSNRGLNFLDYHTIP